MYECTSVVIEHFKTFPEKKTKKNQQDQYTSLVHYQRKNRWP